MNPLSTVARATGPRRLPQGLGAHLPGLAIAAALAWIATRVAQSDLLHAAGVGTLPVAIALGIAFGNTLYPRIGALGGPGVNFARQFLLRLGIALFGFRLTFQQVAQVGLPGMAIDVAMICSTFAFSWFVGTRLLGLDRKLVMLIGTGSAICGAAAVLAAEPIIRGRSERVTVAVSTVVIFGTLATFLYPALFHANAALHWIRLPPGAYGLFVGSTIHEVAQVVAAGNAISGEAANIAVVTKMVRVMMLAPFLVALSALLARDRLHAAPGNHAPNKPEKSPPARISLPWFALAFIAVVGLNSWEVLPAAISGALVQTDAALLAIAMVALGLSTHLSAVRNAGFRPLALGGAILIWLIGGGLAINIAIAALLA